MRNEARRLDRQLIHLGARLRRRAGQWVIETPHGALTAGSLAAVAALVTS